MFAQLGTWIAVVAVLVLATACGCGGGAAVALRSDPHPLVGRTPAPRREMSLDGALVSLPAPGHVTVVDVWATSCQPCEKVMTELVALYAKRRADGFEIIGVATDDNPGLVQQFLATRGVTYPNVVDAEGPVRGALQASELPTTVIFDRKGRVRAVLVGGEPADVGALRDAVEALLAEP